MARIYPFPGLRYNLETISDLSQVLCPPYDIVSPQTRQLCYQRHPLNVVRLEVGEEASLPGIGNRYRQARDLLRRWLKQGVLKPEATPALYLHHHLFPFRKGRRLRRGIMATVGLGGGDIHAHEQTLPQPKEDRLRLLRACRANISPIFALYQDQTGEVASLLAQVEAGPPQLTLEEEGGEGHRLWILTQPQLVARLQALFAPLPLFIADGHHRYETALYYSQERGVEDEAAAQVLMTLVEIRDPGLVILPVHRLVRGLSPELMAKLRGELEAQLDLSPVSKEKLLLIEQGAADGLGLTGWGKSFLLQAKPGGRPLDLLGLHHKVLEGLLGWGKAPGLELAYTPEAAAALNQVESGEYQLAFLVSPFPVERLLEVVAQGGRLPGKATYFYPKLPTGLVLRLL